MPHIAAATQDARHPRPGFQIGTIFVRTFPGFRLNPILFIEQRTRAESRPYLVGMALCRLRRPSGCPADRPSPLRFDCAVRLLDFCVKRTGFRLTQRLP